MYVLTHDIPRGHDLILTGRAPDHDDIERLCVFLDKRRNPVVVDAGANFGCFSLAFERHGANVHAFEPQPVIAALLADSLKLNNSSIALHNAALGRSMGSTRVPIVDYDRQTDFGTVSLRNLDGGLPVEVVTLDSIGLPQLDLLKIDVEGMELDVLGGAAQTILRCRPLIFIEYWHSDEVLLEKELGELGYDIIDRTRMDWLCVPTESAPYAWPFQHSFQKALQKAQRADEMAREAAERAAASDEKAREAAERASKAEEKAREAAERAATADEKARKVAARATIAMERTHRAEACLQAIADSRSWRVTAPLRWCKSALNRLR
jgi:FkbM family methyltransferase